MSSAQWLHRRRRCRGGGCEEGKKREPGGKRTSGRGDWYPFEREKRVVRAGGRWRKSTYANTRHIQPLVPAFVRSVLCDDCRWNDDIFFRIFTPGVPRGSAIHTFPHTSRRSSPFARNRRACIPSPRVHPGPPFTASPSFLSTCRAVFFVHPSRLILSPRVIYMQHV